MYIICVDMVGTGMDNRYLIAYVLDTVLQLWCMEIEFIQIYNVLLINQFTFVPLCTKKTHKPSSLYRDSQYKRETVIRPSYVYNGDTYTHKTAPVLVNRGPAGSVYALTHF